MTWLSNAVSSGVSGTKNIAAFVFGALWLLLLYIFTAWIVVGSLIAVQLQDEVMEELEITFSQLDSFVENFNHKQESLWSDANNIYDSIQRNRTNFNRQQKARLVEFQKLVETYPSRIIFFREGQLENWDQIVESTHRLIDADEWDFEIELEYTLLEMRRICVEERRISQDNDREYTKIVCADIDKMIENHSQHLQSVAELQKQYQIENAKVADKIIDNYKESPYIQPKEIKDFISNIFGYSHFLQEPRELLVLQLTMAMGMLGSIVSMTWSFVRKDGSITVRRFVFLPFVGTVSAVIIFVFLKAGQLTMSAGGGEANLDPFFLSFVGIISGLLSERAYARMESVGRNFFSVDEQKRRWALFLGDKLEHANLDKTEVAHYLQVKEIDIDNLINQKTTATPDQQRLIAAYLRTDIRTLFTDFPPPSDATDEADTEMVIVPDLAGLDQVAAQSVLKELGLTLGNVSEVDRDDIEAGIIIDQEPASGARVTAGSAIGISLSSTAEE